jgi:FkbM family methyltransferase
MGRKIFVDIGGHRGQTVQQIIGAGVEFDEIHSFEPHPEYVELVRRIQDPRLVVHQAALGDRNGKLRLSGDNSNGGATVLDVPTHGPSFEVDCIDIVDFLNRFNADDDIFIKINCEGGEVAIVERLSAQRVRPRIRGMMVDFDIIKVPFGYWKKRRALQSARVAGLAIDRAEIVMVKGIGILNWLAQFPDDFPSLRSRPPRPQPPIRRLRYGLRDVRSAVGLRINWRH